MFAVSAVSLMEHVIVDFETTFRVALNKVIRNKPITDEERRALIDVYNNYAIVYRGQLKQVKDIMDRW